MILLSGLGAGVVCAILFLRIYQLGVFLFGASVGLGLGSTLQSFMIDQLQPFLTLGLGGVFGLTALVFERYTIILATSISGAYAAVGGLMGLMRSQNPIRDFPMQLLSGGLPGYPETTAAGLLLVLVGCVVQLKVTSKG